MNRKRKMAAAAAIAAAIAIAAAGYAISRLAAQPRCIVTQYGDDSGNQGGFYTVKTREGLLVVDGGWAANEEQLRRIIKKNGGTVTAWILTHPHPDHIGAFNAIWQNLDGIEIGQVYTVDMDYDRYRELAREWDEFEVYDTFVQITKDDDRLHYLYTGDELELCGLHMKVLGAYDEGVAEISKDLANDGSLMFKLTNETESMLFCADVGRKMSKRILRQFRDELKCDYLQMGHHGNGGLSEKFYRKTLPKAAFFDAPDWLMHPADAESGYTTPQNRALMESLGAKIYDYSTAPNRIELK